MRAAMKILQRILAFIVGLALLVAAFVFASLLLAVMAVVGLVAWAWLTWRMRKAGIKPAAQGAIIEGEFREVPAEPPRRIERD
jgi:hypothetical protein